jgi:membrane protease YdiL (CAAX protease family)
MSRVLWSSNPSQASRGWQRPDTIVTGRRLLLALGVWMLVSGISGTITVLAARSVSVADVTALVVAEIYTLLIAVLVIVMRPSSAQALGLVRCRFGDVGLAALACGGAYLVTAALQSIGGPWPWSSAIAILTAMGSDDGRLATAGPVAAGVIIVRASLLAAVGEEVLFRGALYAWLRQRTAAGVAIAVSAAAHAAIHGFPAILPLAFVMGLGFGWVRERSGSTVPTIIVHALHNAGLIVWAYFVAGWTARLPAWG